MRTRHIQPWSIADLLHRDAVRTAPLRFAAKALPDAPAHWTPAVDIIDEKERCVLRADIPGVDAADIDVAMDDGVLTVSGVRQADKRAGDAGVERIERSTGPFQRRFKLPDSVDSENISAKSRNGILEVAIPKLPEIQARRIAVEAA